MEKIEKYTFLIVFLMILYAKDFIVLANIILASAIITKVLIYLIKLFGLEEMLKSKTIIAFVIFVFWYVWLNT